MSVFSVAKIYRCLSLFVSVHVHSDCKKQGVKHWMQSQRISFLSSVGTHLSLFPQTVGCIGGFVLRVLVDESYWTGSKNKNAIF